jgi:hypothetical protein
VIIMLTAEQAIAAAETNAGPEAVVDQAWLGTSQVIALFASASGADDFDGQGPTVVDLTTGQMTYPGSAVNPATLLKGKIRIR